jgi:hypothetical protein
MISQTDELERCLLIAWVRVVRARETGKVAALLLISLERLE